MSIDLYHHNERAYRAVRKMLAEKGLVAVVHPTGTGKSFVAFKLCEDNRFESQWSRAYRDAEMYYRQHGTLDMPVAYIAPDGFALRKWVRRQRYALRKPEQGDTAITQERLRLLSKIGMTITPSL